MRIHVRTKDVKLWIPLPNCLLCNRLASRILADNINNNQDQITVTPEQVDLLLKMLPEARKTLQGLPLVDVHTKDGETVRITL